MAEEPECQLRRRRSSGNPNLPLKLDGYQVNEGNPEEGTPSPSKPYPGTSKRSSSAALMEFKNKQQSFDLHVIQVEECEIEEIVLDSDEEGDEEEASGIERAVTPTPIQDFGANVVYTEDIDMPKPAPMTYTIIVADARDFVRVISGFLKGPQQSDFLRVKALENDGYTDVSDADTEEEE